MFCDDKGVVMRFYERDDCTGKIEKTWHFDEPSEGGVEKENGVCLQERHGKFLGSVRTSFCTVECFHEDTVVLYRNRVLTLPGLLEEDELFVNGKTEIEPLCHVPHVVVADGVKINTSCPNSRPLRLTFQHLVFTSRGLVRAEDISAGDIIYKDFEETEACLVIYIEKEKNQKYFGLNCEESVVLADGWKTSTFGVVHYIPAMWMELGSKLVGVRKASEFGDWLVSWITFLSPSSFWN